MKNNQFHILLEVPESFPENLEETLSEINHDKLLIYGVKKPPEVWSSLEWAIPGLIVAYIAKPYFEGFLQEMGKDHYEKLKVWLKRLLEKSRNIKVSVLSVGENKIDPANTQSKAISIFVQIKNGQQIKLLFDEDLTLNDWQNKLDNILDLISDNYQNHPNDQLTKRLQKLKRETYYTIYAFLDRDTKEWRFIDDHGLFQIQREIAEKKEKVKKKKKK